MEKSSDIQLRQLSTGAANKAIIYRLCSRIMTYDVFNNFIKSYDDAN